MYCHPDANSLLPVDDSYQQNQHIRDKNNYDDDYDDDDDDDVGDGTKDELQNELTNLNIFKDLLNENSPTNNLKQQQLKLKTEISDKKPPIFTNATLSLNKNNTFSPKFYKQTHLPTNLFLNKNQKRSSPQSNNSHTNKVTKRANLLNQARLDFGQKQLQFIVCAECEMAYNILNEDDHKKFHYRLIYPPCLTFIGWKNERVVYKSQDWRILQVLCTDIKQHINRLQQLWLYLEEQHGFVPAINDFSPQQLQQGFLFIEEKKKMITGCCFIEEIASANEIIINSANSSTCSASEKVLHAELGILRFWVHPQHRRASIATHLINAALNHFYTDRMVPLDLLAFSDPSPEGIGFAVRFTGKMNFLVYSKNYK